MAEIFGQNHLPVFPISYHELRIPATNALAALGGIGTRRQIVLQIIAALGFPPLGDSNYWDGLEPAHRDTDPRRRRVLIEERTGEALQDLRRDGVVVLQGENWHLQP